MRHGCFFDLDGTLADTAPDLAAALNRILSEEGRAPLPYAAIRPTVSHGALAMVRHAFGERTDEARLLPLRDRLVAYYAADIAAETRLFDGMQALLEALEKAGIPWGVVTNKPGYLTTPLLAALGLAQRCSAVVSGDTLTVSKPDPAPLLHACRLAGCDPQASWYVGDAERDIEAARRAGMGSVLALYGYLDTGEAWSCWRADHTVERPDQLPQLLLRSYSRP